LQDPDSAPKAAGAGGERGRENRGVGCRDGSGAGGGELLEKKRKPKVKIPGSLRCLVAEAVREFEMIGAGDRVLVGLSGGKDSLTMLHVLLELQRRSPVTFELAAATVDPQTPEYDPGPLVPYLEELGVRYHVLSKPIIEMAKTCMDPKRPSLCSFCSRMKRGLLYSCMREHGYTCLALGQHLDDGGLVL
jgi:tRNA 2-thiocytidine biosynthesis protein TtcA